MARKLILKDPNVRFHEVRTGYESKIPMIPP